MKTRTLSVFQSAPSLPVSHFLSLLRLLNKLVVREKPHLMDLKLKQF